MLKRKFLYKKHCREGTFLIGNFIYIEFYEFQYSFYNHKNLFVLKKIDTRKVNISMY